MLKRIFIWHLLIVLLFIPAHSFASSDYIQLTDMLKIKQIGSVTHSPDGSQVVFTITEVVEHADDDANPYRYRTHLWIAPTDGSRAPRALTFGDQSASQPTWHPDGTRLAFVRAHDGRPQIFVLSFEGGEPMPYTDHSRGASGPNWSPDGKKLLFSSSVRLQDLLKDSTFAAGPDWSLEQPGRTVGDIPEGTKANPDGNIDEIRAWLEQNVEKNNPRVLNRLNFQAETDLNPTVTFSHLYVMDAEPGAEAVALTSGYQSFGGASWSADSRHIYLQTSTDNSEHPDRDSYSGIYRIDADGSNFTTIVEIENHSVFGPQISPNGHYLAFISRDMNDRAYSQSVLQILNIRSGAITELTASLDRGVGGVTWSVDSRHLYFTSNSNGGTPLFRVNLSGQIDRLTSFENGIRSFDVTGNTVSYVLTEIANPYELYTARLSTARNASGENLLINNRRLSSINAEWLAGKKLSYPEVGILQNDGYDIQYWIMKPTTFVEGEQYPLMLQIHGGPAAMWGPGEVSMWLEFQYFAAQGYGIVYSNPRGSGGYGRDFQAGNYQDWGFGPASDVLAATDIATALPWADADRLVTTGGSYAGYLVAWIVGHDHRFKAAFAQRGVYDLATFLGEGNAWRLNPGHFGGYPWESAEIDSIYRANSPMTYVGQIQTPLLIKHGDVDLRTGVIQSEMLYKALKIQEKPVEYVRYPRASHEMSRSGEVLQRMDRILRIHEFFERYIR